MWLIQGELKVKHTSKILLGLATAFAFTGAMAHNVVPDEARPEPAAAQGERPAPRAITRAQAIEMATKRFDAADIDKDGVLTPAEMRTAFARGHGDRKGPPRDGEARFHKGPPHGEVTGEHRGPPPPSGFEAEAPPPRH